MKDDLRASIGGKRKIDESNKQWRFFEPNRILFLSSIDAGPLLFSLFLDVIFRKIETQTKYFFSNIIPKKYSFYCVKTLIRG